MTDIFKNIFCQKITLTMNSSYSVIIFNYFETYSPHLARKRFMTCPFQQGSQCVVSIGGD